VKKHLNPKLLFIINTLPIILLFFFFLGQYNLIKTLLDREYINTWLVFGIILGVLAAANFAYAAYLTWKKQNIHIHYGFIALVCYIAFIYLYYMNIDSILPWSIPQWMISVNVYINVGAFLMPTLAYSMFILVEHFTQSDKKHKLLPNFFVVLGIPLAGFLYIQLILPLWKPYNHVFPAHAFLILVIIATLVFIFFLVRCIFIIILRSKEKWIKYQLIWKIPITTIFPLLGLALNNELFEPVRSSNVGIFGNFNDVWFYILAALNGALLCIPSLENKIYRIFIFTGRSVLFSFTFYFFIVFLPYLPFSIVAILMVGTGFLMLTPLMLFPIHVFELKKDYLYLKSWLSNKLIIGISVLGFLLIPVCITISYVKDKFVLNNALEYLYSPDYSRKYNINKKSLQKTLNNIKINKSRGGRNIVYDDLTPYLSSYFNWIVLNNLTLSDAKIYHAEKVFFGRNPKPASPASATRGNVEITDISTISRYDNSQNAWKSWVNFELTNKTDSNALAEYTTTVFLPEGCWISDYYLDIEGRREEGILAERKTAMWVYYSIVTARKDPGILFYLNGNKVSFRVFPFSRDEKRKTGIEFLHREPVSINIDGKTIELGEPVDSATANIETEDFIYVSAHNKQFLNRVTRKPYFHFIVDTSLYKDNNSISFYSKYIDNAINANREYMENAKISFVNTYVNTYPLDNNWISTYESQTFEGGFFLDRAIKTALFNAYKDNTYPVFVIVTTHVEEAVAGFDFTDFLFAVPEGIVILSIDDDGFFSTIQQYCDEAKKLNKEELKEFLEWTVLEYPLSGNTTVYLQDNNEASIILKKDSFNINTKDIKEKDIISAISMQAKHMSHILYPQLADRQWKEMVRHSFTSKIMTPVTSYLAVENEAQKAVLLNKQKQVLSGDKTLDIDENSQEMSEPPIWILAIFLCLALWYNNRRKKIKEK
jgi:hypothetical protein